MRTSRWIRGTVMAGGASLAFIGVLHDIVGLPGLRRAVARGEVAERLAGQLMMNWFFSGAAIAMLGILVLLAAWELDTAGRLARRVIILTGVLFVAVGAISYAWHPRPTVLVFAVLGAMLLAPLLVELASRPSPAPAR